MPKVLKGYFLIVYGNIKVTRAGDLYSLSELSLIDFDKF